MSMEQRVDSHLFSSRPPQLNTIQSGDNSSISVFSEERNSEWRAVPINERLALYGTTGKEEHAEPRVGDHSHCCDCDCACDNDNDYIHDQRLEEEKMREERNARLWDEYRTLLSQYQGAIQNIDQLKRRMVSVNNRISESENEKRSKEIEIQNTRQLIAESIYCNVGIKGNVLFVVYN